MAEITINRKYLEAHPHGEQELEQPLAGLLEDTMEEQLLPSNVPMVPQSTPSLLEAAMEKPSKGKKRADLAEEPQEPPSISDICPKPLFKQCLVKPVDEQDLDLYLQ
ncbi:hypothetical protein AX14_006977 [Amanita brunnescens Koide BX004]|nr:hypothetical protein AX14_006977 [Amanita brunnescens Koide BX004]